MTVRQQIQQIPSALSKTLEKGRAEFGAVARKIRWGDGPVLVCGESECLELALRSGSAFETFPGWPVVAHSAEVFQTYAVSLLKPHSVLIVISPGENRPETEELARVATQRGCIVVVLTNSAESPLLKHAHHSLLIAAEVQPRTPSMAVCLQSALNLFAFDAAQALKRPEPFWKDVNEEFHALPEKIDWLVTQLSPLVRSFASEIAKLANLKIVGTGLYEYPAFGAANRLQSLASLRVEALETTALLNSNLESIHSGDGVMFISGSHSKLKKLVHRCAEAARAKGARVFSITDGNDRDLATGSDIGLLIPSLQEMPSATATLFMLEWLIAEVVHAVKA